jgi:5-methylcytosine-specific restriction endonuclease McrA
MNRSALAINKAQFQAKGIMYCESCGTHIGLTIAHRKKRRHYQTLEELTKWDEIILLCMREHEQIEKDPMATANLFARLRP